jgi:hypothetical protein
VEFDVEILTIPFMSVLVQKVLAAMPYAFKLVQRPLMRLARPVAGEIRRRDIRYSFSIDINDL